MNNEKRVSSSTYGATQKVKESVKNASQKKNEFLKKLQEIENISVIRPRKNDKLGKNDVEIDGTVHFSTQDDYYKKEDDLHQDLELIEQELMKVMYLHSFFLDKKGTFYKLAYNVYKNRYWMLRKGQECLSK